MDTNYNAYQLDTALNAMTFNDQQLIFDGENSYSQVREPVN